MHIRPMTPEDDLMPFLVLTMNWEAGRDWDEARVLAAPAIAHYIEGWMRDGDAGLLAEHADTPVGCAWWRLADASDPGYGFVAEDVPEIGLAVVPELQGRGVGRKLLETLIARARAEGLPGLSLSVEDGNDGARRLYESLGFVAVGRAGSSDTMLLGLVPPEPFRGRLADPELEEWVERSRREAPRTPLLSELRAPRERRPGPEVASAVDATMGTPHPLPVRRYVPADADAACVVYVHGGGFVHGGLDSHDRVCRRLATLAAVEVIAVDYRLAPEHAAPAAVDDVCAVVRALATDEPGRPVALAGDSAGALIAYLAARRLVDAGVPVARLLLVNPNVDPRLRMPSVRAKGSGWGLTEAGLRWFLAQWVGEGPVEALAPLELSAQGMPPTRIVVSEHDPLRDEGVALSEHLAAAQVHVCLDELAGMVHGFLTLDDVSPAARARGDDVLAACRREKGGSPEGDPPRASGGAPARS
ncbi:GNAT family N-acetyltransferase [Demequina capsici]|uniref:GNAT family N-acetyltransferase n=1 Tax=Demequina capsici TaxID=3075620 RepID=A0AA96FFA0_9MICO|nr:GNAT family N-acetyltransferase [Demequina sp. PMTSA13]WNM28570.1 GNAT family N-acetyltransferase [Demequina sp. PMTSA13]